MFYDKFNPTQMTIKDFKYWTIVLRAKQQTLGDAVIILKNEHTFIGEGKAEEFAEFPYVVNWYENKCRNVFGAEKFNYLAAMMKDNFIHFHAFPRYSKAIEFCGKNWVDTDWPRPVTPAGIAVEENEIEALLKVLRD